eukprot:7899-Heterococcus_DN1.PRE.2
MCLTVLLYTDITACSCSAHSAGVYYKDDSAQCTKLSKCSPTTLSRLTLKRSNTSIGHTVVIVHVVHCLVVSTSASNIYNSDIRYCSSCSGIQYTTAKRLQSIAVLDSASIHVQHCRLCNEDCE